MRVSALQDISLEKTLLHLWDGNACYADEWVYIKIRKNHTKPYLIKDPKKPLEKVETYRSHQEAIDRIKQLIAVK